VTDLKEIETVVAATNAVSVPDQIKAALVADLKPIAQRLGGYEAAAESVSITTDNEAEEAADIVRQIQADVDAVTTCETMDKIIKGLHGLHRQWTAARGMFLDPLDKCKRTINTCLKRYQEDQRIKAEALQRKLQAEAEAKARKERERLEAQAAKLKTPEKAAAKMDEAAAIVVPVIMVHVQKFANVRKVWKIQKIDFSVFLAAAAKDQTLVAYIKMNETAMERSKAANKMIEIPGVTFEQVIQ